jgi:hypothetical protein
MAKPRVFVSSTFYDLRTVRDDIDRFIRSVGFEPVRHERGHIAYGQNERPEEYAYREVDFCEILVCIIGGKFGTTSATGPYSITQKELKTALDRGKQVYVFVDESVHHEHRYYLANKTVTGVRYTAVDNVKIHEFLEEIYALPKGNPIFPFAVSSDITNLLSEQWAGLFQRLLTESAAKSQAALVEELQRSLQTVGQLVQFLVDEKGKGDKAVQEILFANHPVFEALYSVLRNRYRIYFTTLTELHDWLAIAKSFRKDEFEVDPDYYEWTRDLKIPNKPEVQTLYVAKKLFGEDGRLLPMLPASWNSDWVKLEKIAKKVSAADKAAADDDIPF